MHYDSLLAQPLWLELVTWGRRLTGYRPSASPHQGHLVLATAISHTPLLPAPVHASRCPPSSTRGWQKHGPHTVAAGQRGLSLTLLVPPPPWARFMISPKGSLPLWSTEVHHPGVVCLHIEGTQVQAHIEAGVHGHESQVSSTCCKGSCRGLPL
jgi:hypothetical protein